MKAGSYQMKRFPVIFFLLIFVISFNACIGPVPVDVVMMDNELFFVLEEEHEIDSLRVIAAVDRKKMGTDEKIKSMWTIGHNVTTPVESRKYATLKQIKYGQKFVEYPVMEGPLPLQKNVEYSVVIKMGNKFASESFIITSDNKVTIPQRRVKEKRKE